MVDRRRFLQSQVALLGASGVFYPPARAQQNPQVRRIGYLGVRSRSTVAKPDIYYDAFVRGLRELGYVEGRNLLIEWRFADGNYALLPALATELFQSKVEVLVTHTTP